MKKVMLFLMLGVFTLSSSSFNERSSSLPNSGCVQSARADTLALADGLGDDPNGSDFRFYLSVYMSLYTSCLDNLR